MKKFLSLVMALVMTMSLVTIGAGATEYKDLTDKDEIQYAEAVTVLNKLGIISGYEDGSFRPTGALTRGAAAKIIVSLIQGADFANALTVTAAPYSDVPVTNTFAAVISYCKTAGYINGYTDGTFRPAAALTGYAFSKMLLGALGYKSEYEGFTGAGWTMNVAALGSTAGLFNDFLGDGFKGNDGVDRQSACLLALNTLKATEVKYEGGTSISSSTGDLTTNIQQKPTRSYVTSNNGDFNQNISSNKIDSNQSQYYTLEFGEDHFHDLKLRPDVDDYGCPANTWSFKNVKIGTYAKTADFTFTEGIGASTDSDATLETKLGMKNYKLSPNLAVEINGLTSSVSSVANIARNLTGNGTIVKVYLNNSVADQIDNIAVIRTQPMQVDKVTSAAVTLKQLDLNATDKQGVKVQSVEDTDDYYNKLKDLKADDIVIITPLTTDDSTYEVDGVFIPTTATGKIASVKLNNAGNPNGLTVESTDYKFNQMWTVEDGRQNLDKSSVSTTVDTTLYLDSFGYMSYAANVKASSSFILFDEIYANTVNNRIHYFATGYDMSGNELSLDIGTANPGTLTPGAVYQYDEAVNTSNADYVLKDAADPGTDRLVYVPAGTGAGVITNFKGIAAGNSSFTFGAKKANAGAVGAANAADYVSNTNEYDSTAVYFDKGVKFLFDTFESGELTGITVKDSIQAVTTATDMYFVMNKDKNRIQTVVIMNDSDVEVSQNIMYISKIERTITNAAGDRASVVTAWMNGNKTEGLEVDKYLGTSVGFYTYAEGANGVYKVNSYNPATGRTQFILPNSNTTVNSGTPVTSVVLNTKDISAKNYVNQLYLNGSGVGTAVTALGVVGAGEVLNFSGCNVIDLVDMQKNVHEQFSSLGDLVDYAAEKGYHQKFTVALMYNTSTNANAQTNRVAYMYVLDVAQDNSTPVVTGDYTLPATPGVQYSINNGAYTAANTLAYANAGDTVRVQVDAAASAVTTVPAQAVTNVSAGVFQFTMPASNITSVTVTIPGAYSGKSAVDISAPATVKLLWKGLAAPTLDEAVVLIKKELEANGYSNVTPVAGTAASPLVVKVTAQKTVGGMLMPAETFTMTAASDMSQAVDITVVDATGVSTEKFVAVGTTLSAATVGITADYAKASAPANTYLAKTTVLAAGDDGKTYTDGFWKLSFAAAVTGTPGGITTVPTAAFKNLTAAADSNFYVTNGTDVEIELTAAATAITNADVKAQITVTNSTSTGAMISGAVKITTSGATWTSGSVVTVETPVTFQFNAGVTGGSVVTVALT